MQTSFTFKIVYSLTVALLVVMSLIFGIRALWDGPDVARTTAAGAKSTFETYESDRADHHRNVFIATTTLGVLLIAASIASYPRWEPLPLAFLLSGLGVMLYGLVDGQEDIGRNQEAYFVMAAASVTVVLGAGYWFLARPQQTE